MDQYRGKIIQAIMKLIALLPPLDEALFLFKVFLWVGFQFFILVGRLFAIGEPTIGRYIMFLRKSFSAPKDLSYSTAIIFDRNQGEVNRESYKWAYGSQGQRLVEAYGKGLSKKQLQAMGYL